MTDVHDDLRLHETIVVVLPTYNELDSLPLVVRALAELNRSGLQVLVVDDNSPDGTGLLADHLAGDPDNRLSVLHRRVKAGLGNAYAAGMTHALRLGADVVVQMDADLSHPASSLPAMLQALSRPGVGVVLGSRYVPGGSIDADWPRRRLWLSRTANRYVDAILRLGVRDATSGFKAWRADALEDVDPASARSDGYAFQVEMNYRAARCGWEIMEAPITFSDRRHGRSKMTTAVVGESMLAPWRLRLGRWQPTGQLTEVYPPPELNASLRG